VAVSENIRRELVRLCSRRGTRTAEFTRGCPTHWSPHEAYDPNTGQPYTEDGAWQRIAEEIESGCDLWERALDKPPGKTGFVVNFEDAKGKKIYVKLQLGAKVIGRSFHEERKND
jgi:hypothetical protein